MRATAQLATRPARAQQRASVARSIPAPVEGWDTETAIADMGPARALILDNWFPSTADVQLRRGYDVHAFGAAVLVNENGVILTDENGNILTTDGPSGTVETLMVWNGPGASRKMFGVADLAFWECTVEGGMVATGVSGLLSNRWQWVNFATSGGEFLIAVDGVDAPRNYNGTAWATTPAITGVEPALLVAVMAHKKRLWLVERDSASAWYLATNAIGGAATEFLLGSVFQLGGFLMTAETWSIDGGMGIDDFAIFVSSKGEIAVYQGIDPAVDFKLVGVYRVGEPIGRRCTLKVGGDIAIITVDGVVPLSSILSIDRGAVQKVTITSRIRRAIADASQLYRANFGWQLIGYPRGYMAILNVPVSATVSHQYVMNSLTGAWCRFVGLDAACWALFEDNAYFGGAGAVYVADSGSSDNGAFIMGDIKTAFNAFGEPHVLKQFKMIRPLITADGDLQYQIDLNIDFSDEKPVSVPTDIGSTDGIWDESLWDQAYWAGSIRTLRDWTGVTGIGYWAAVRMQVATRRTTLQVAAFDLMMERGGLL